MIASTVVAVTATSSRAAITSTLSANVADAAICAWLAELPAAAAALIAAVLAAVVVATADVAAIADCCAEEAEVAA
ncbi:hypothetical protein D3C71_1925410 [compost metagenome]